MSVDKATLRLSLSVSNTWYSHNIIIMSDLIVWGLLHRDHKVKVIKSQFLAGVIRI